MPFSGPESPEPCQLSSMSAVTADSVSGMPRSGGPLVGHRQQPADPAGDRVLGHRRVGQLAQLLQRRLAVRDPQPAGLAQVVGRLVAEDLPARARPGPRPPPRPGPTGAGSRRRSWPAGWRSPGPRGASAAPPRPASRSARPAGSAARRWRRRPGPAPGPRRAPPGPWPRCPSGGPRRPAPAPPPGPGQVTSSEALRPGSVSEPCARNAPRQAASASPTDPATICGGRPRTGRPRWSIRPVCRASESPPPTTRTT